MKTNYTQVGKEAGYYETEIAQAINAVQWEPFRTDNLPFSQGSCLKTVVRECKIPLSGIKQMCLHGGIKNVNGETHAFYALDVVYKNGRAQLFIADNGCEACVVCSLFEPKESEASYANAN